LRLDLINPPPAPDPEVEARADAFLARVEPFLQKIDAEAIERVGADLARILDDDGAGQRLVDLAHALHAGRYDDAIDLVLAHNQFVMHSRNGSQPWIRRNGAKLEVRYRDDSQKRILTRQEVANAWQSTFYIDPLKLVSDQLRSLH
jgi:hypothetical protein